MELSIVTATYNREILLKRVYDSIQKQKTNIDFEWIVVDDGSTDNTNEYINLLKKTASFPIKYYYQKNSGQVEAARIGYSSARGEYLLVLDSDDYLVDDAFALIKQLMNEIAKDDSVIAANTLRDFGYDNHVKNQFPDHVKTGMMDIKFRYRINVETSPLFKTKLINQYSMPVIEGERFSSGEYRMNEYSKDYSVLNIRKSIVGGAYQSDGDTANVFKIWVNAPINTILMLQSRYEYLRTRKYKQKYTEMIKALINLGAFNIKMKKKITENSPNLFLSILLIFPSFIWFLRRFKNI
ncbi:MAG: glycosyltransferase family A protein [Enterococcus avium]|jgi:glycosyltransferase involved in cell wall biosynthesis